VVSLNQESPSIYRGECQTADVDDERARRIEDNFQRWSESLFISVFQDFAAQNIFGEFQRAEEAGRLLTISASHPAILSLPWELLRDPASNIYLFKVVFYLIPSIPEN
jgi:hypothetical protein